MRVAIIHDQLAEFGGAERVLISLKAAYPQADVYVSFVDWRRLGIHGSHFRDWRIRESWARYIPAISRLYSPLRFLLPLIWRSWDLSTYDLVICSSSWGMCKGVALQKLKKHQASSSKHQAPPASLAARSSQLTRFVCYLHTPPRYLYGYDESPLKRYLIVRIYALIVNHLLRHYDYLSSQAIDAFIFNSQEVRRRSLKYYRRDGIVINPPVQTAASREPRASSETANWKLQIADSDYYLTVSRLAPTKHIDVLIRACNELARPLIVVGTGHQSTYLKSIAGPTITFAGHVDDSQLAQLYAHARAFLYASVDEDYGMVPVEAMAHGIPVIAYASGGVKETVTQERGRLYDSLTPEAVASAILRYESLDAHIVADMRQLARSYARERDEAHYIRQIREHIDQLMSTAQD